jgi:A/G-specific adenine glycosylase
VKLQQTQVARVMAKYAEWMVAFPNFEALADASVAEVLQLWSGLGYNRRALNLHKLAQIVVRDYGGKLPEQPSELIKLPGIGAGTAGSIAAFAFNAPVVFIETNIRRVFLHHFSPVIARSKVTKQSHRGDSHAPLAMTDKIGDKELLPLVEAALDRGNPREWYYALMDYGTYLAGQVPNPNRQSKHYAKQSRFEGSDRQVRGEILRQLLAGPKSVQELEALDPRVVGLLPILEKEGFIICNAGVFQLS